MLLVSALKAKATSSTQTFRQQSDVYLTLLIFLYRLFTSLPELVDEPVSSTSEESFLEDDCYEPLADNKSPILITQAFLNDLVRDLNLPKESAEFLGCRLQTTTFLLPTQHIPGTGKKKKIWYNIFPWRKHLCIVTMLPVFFRRWLVYMTQQNGDFLLTVRKPA